MVKQEPDHQVTWVQFLYLEGEMLKIMQKSQKNKMEATVFNKDQVQSDYDTVLAGLDEKQRKAIETFNQMQIAQMKTDIQKKLRVAINDCRGRIAKRRKGVLPTDAVPSWTITDIDNIAQLHDKDIDAFLQAKYTPAGKKPAPVPAKDD